MGSHNSPVSLCRHCNQGINRANGFYKWYHIGGPGYYSCNAHRNNFLKKKELWKLGDCYAEPILEQDIVDRILKKYHKV